METRICSDVFMNFYSKINRDGLTTTELLREVEEAVTAFSEELHIGKAEFHLDAPVTFFEPAGMDKTVVMFQKEPYGTDIITREYVTGENGSMRFTVYAQKGYNWSAGERKELRFLIENIYHACSGSRLWKLIHRATMTDAATGAVNAIGIQTYVDSLYRRNKLKEYTSIFINIKNFKYINQRAGHSQADRLLREYCVRMLDYLEDDEMFARLGGDNFLVLSRKENAEKCIQFLSCQKVYINTERGDQEHEIAVRMGVYSINEGDTMAEIMQRTSTAMSISRKPAGDDIIWFKDAMLQQTIHDKEIAGKFHKAIENHEFVVYYQPKVTLEDKKLCSGEALSRWIQDGKVVAPVDFIPILEREGDICTLDFYVLDTVCRDLRDWLDRGIEPVRISVNFSKMHLHNKNLAEDVISVLQKYNIDSKYIEVELTELSGYEDFEALSNFVDEMKNAGIETSIDDFGTGYSSLNLLKDLNVDIIKLDKSFLSSLNNEDQMNEPLIRNIINMVNELDLKVVAEGVENDKQLNFLKMVNCSMAQGFLFDKPLPREQFEWRLMGERMY